MTQSDTADSLYALYQSCDPALLKQTRAAVGMEEGVLARMACLSTSQVRQLEAGGSSLFYSMTIKRQAYKRVMMVLGADPPTHVPLVSMDETVSAVASSKESNNTIDNIVALSNKSDYLEKKPLQDFFLDLRFRIVAHRQFTGALLFLLAAVTLLILNWQYAPSLTEKASTELLQTDSSAAQSVSSGAATNTVAAAPSLSSEDVSSMTGVASAAPATAPNAAELPASAVLPSQTTQANTGSCEFAPGPLAEVVSTSNSKPANYVYFVSPVSTTVCVVDNNKKATLLELRPNEGRSVYGSPPWQLAGKALQDTQIYFQGFRIKPPVGHDKHFQLQENKSAP